MTVSPNGPLLTQVPYQGKKYFGNSEAKLLKKSSIEWDLAVTSRCKRMGLGGFGLTHTWLASLSDSSLLCKCPAGRLATRWSLMGGSVCWGARNADPYCSSSHGTGLSGNAFISPQPSLCLFQRML